MTGDDRQASEEAVGRNFDPAGMLEARRRTWEAVDAIASQIVPGMVEEEATALARKTLKELGLLRGWHGIYVRFGRNTLCYFGAKSEPGVVLGEDDIFFIDIGPVWQKFEGDAGNTFVTGSDPEMLAARRDVRILHDIVARHWREQGVSGRALYDFADAEARKLGWRLHLDVGGHRLSDFPHGVIYQGELRQADYTPTSGLWVLEIQLRHPERPFGAFFEDLLLQDGE